MKILLRNGIEVDQRLDYWGRNLQAAALSGDLESFQQMLQRGGSLNPPACCYGRTLDAAIQGANAALVVWALDAGVEVWLASEDDDIQTKRDLWSSPMGTTATEPSSEAQVDSRNWKQELFASAEIFAPEIRYKYHPERLT